MTAKTLLKLMVLLFIQFLTSISTNAQTCPKPEPEIVGLCNGGGSDPIYKYAVKIKPAECDVYYFTSFSIKVQKAGGGTINRTLTASNSTTITQQTPFNVGSATKVLSGSMTVSTTCMCKTGTQEDPPIRKQIEGSEAKYEETCPSPPETEKSINNFHDSNITVFPNPSSGLINIEYSGYEEKDISIRIYDSFGNDIMGKIVSTESTQNSSNINTLRVDLFNLPNGVYLLEVNDGAILNSSRFVIQK